MLEKFVSSEKNAYFVTRIADPGCLSWIPGPNFYPSRILNPKTATKENAKKKFCPTFFVAINITKLKVIFIFELLKKKIWANLQRIVELFTQKTDKALKNMVRDPGFRKKPIPDSQIICFPRDNLMSSAPIACAILETRMFPLMFSARTLPWRMCRSSTRTSWPPRSRQTRTRHSSSFRTSRRPSVSGLSSPNQCFGSVSEGSVSFWASQIRIRWLDPWFLGTVLWPLYDFLSVENDVRYMYL